MIASSLRLAREDLKAARVLAKSNNRNAVYLCEQAAEKVIIAILTSEGKHGGIRHHLDAMVDLIPDPNPIKALLRSIEDLSAYATTYRYPTTAGRIPSPPSPERLADWMDKVDRALAEAITGFGVDLEARDSPAKRSAPFR